MDNHSEPANTLQVGIHTKANLKPFDMCNFSIPFTGAAGALVDKLKNALTKGGGTFNGDASSGSLSVSTPIGSVSGSYTINVSSLNVTIDHKPVFVSCTQIENYLNNYLNSGG